MSKYAKKQPYKSDKPCMYVLTRGCKKGDDCNFMHPKTTEETQKVLDEMMKAAAEKAATR
jgi:Zinc finger C-x8-C-x5-C-x3-H type (and similar)